MRDDKLKRMLSEKENVAIPEDFDDNMMSFIRKHAAEQVVERKYIRLMYLFFVLGVALGFVVAIMFNNVELSLMGKVYTVHKLAVAIPLVLIILFVFERIYKATLVSLGKDKFSAI